LRNCRICKTPCVSEYRRITNSGNSSYCFIEALEYKRSLKYNKIKEGMKSMKEFISEESIKVMVEELANKINEDYKEIHLIGLLKGSFVFLADLMRKITIPVTVDFMSVRSYEGTESTGEVKVLKELNESIYDKDILIVEDIIDTGNTLRSIIDLLLLKHPKSLEIVTLLDKPSRRIKKINAKYTGFTIEDKFVVGYGIDSSQAYRQLPYIGTVPYNVSVGKEEIK